MRAKEADTQSERVRRREREREKSLSQGLQVRRGSSEQLISLPDGQEEEKKKQEELECSLRADRPRVDQGTAVG